jgi:hypothetical protein
VPLVDVMTGAGLRLVASAKPACWTLAYGESVGVTVPLASGSLAQSAPLRAQLAMVWE